MSKDKLELTDVPRLSRSRWKAINKEEPLVESVNPPNPLTSNEEDLPVLPSKDYPYCSLLAAQDPSIYRREIPQNYYNQLSFFESLAPKMKNIDSKELMLSLCKK